MFFPLNHWRHFDIEGGHCLVFGKTMSKYTVQSQQWMLLGTKEGTTVIHPSGDGKALRKSSLNVEEPGDWEHVHKKAAQWVKATKLKNRTHIGEWENWLSLVVLWPRYGTCTQTHRQTQINNCNKNFSKKMKTPMRQETASLLRISLMRSSNAHSLRAAVSRTSTQRHRKRHHAFQVCKLFHNFSTSRSWN